MMMTTTKMTMTALAIATVLLTVAAQAQACGIEGNARRTDGSRVDGTARVSASWNWQETYPRNGYYVLALGSSACGERTTVFVNGYELRSVRLPNSGNARVDFTLKGSGDVPVR